MKQIAQNYRSGELVVLDVPPPACRAGGVLVRSLYSLISTGTELMKFSEAKLSLVGKARARPDQVRKVLDSVATQGAVSTYKKVMTRLDSYTPLGYSLCGVVTEVGAGAEEFSVGQLVAAAGNEHALHAEYNWVPKNLCVGVPDGVPPEQAAFATVGAIAMHGVRQGKVQLGETAVVIGLGLVGQLVVRLLVAAGVRVFGVDVVPQRCRLAEKAGALHCAAPDEDTGSSTVQQALADTTGGIGADHVFLAAGGSSDGPVRLAAQLARDRARVVDIGKCRLDLPWNAYYDKELDVRFSRSYGPGRYDARYELDGVDYPVGYVRWSERRNLACFLDLIAREQIDVGSLVSGVFGVAEAADVYHKLGSSALDGVGFLFDYPSSTPQTDTATDMDPEGVSAQPPAAVPAPTRRSGSGGSVRVGFVGAGNYASAMLLPHLAGDDAVTLAHVATNTSLSAVNAKRRFGFAAASTEADAVLDDESLDAVFVVTRHSTHADLVCRALERGRTVFVEKPLALTEAEVDRIAAVVARTGNDRVMVGFNRRFSGLFTELRAAFGAPQARGAARYLVNAGKLDAGSWYSDEQAEGSRFAGEGGHFVDALCWWFGSTPSEVYAAGGPEPADRHVTLHFPGGAVGTLSYVTGGSTRFQKETFDASAGGRSARLDDFRRATVWSSGRGGARLRRRQDKGQRAQLRLFVDACRTGAPMPVGLDQLVATTRATLAAELSVASGRREPV